DELRARCPASITFVGIEYWRDMLRFPILESTSAQRRAPQHRRSAGRLGRPSVKGFDGTAPAQLLRRRLRTRFAARRGSGRAGGAALAEPPDPAPRDGSR